MNNNSRYHFPKTKVNKSRFRNRNSCVATDLYKILFQMPYLLFMANHIM